MNDILDKAEELGKLVAASDRYKAVEAARDEVQKDADLQRDAQALSALGRKIAQLEKDVKPVEPEDKRRLRELQEKVTAHPEMRKLARSEADFAELMNRISRAIHGQLVPPPPSSSPS